MGFGAFEWIAQSGGNMLRVVEETVEGGLVGMVILEEGWGLEG